MAQSHRRRELYHTHRGRTDCSVAVGRAKAAPEVSIILRGTNLTFVAAFLFKTSADRAVISDSIRPSKSRRPTRRWRAREQRGHERTMQLRASLLITAIFCMPMPVTLVCARA